MNAHAAWWWCPQTSRLRPRCRSPLIDQAGWSCPSRGDEQGAGLFPPASARPAASNSWPWNRMGRPGVCCWYRSRTRHNCTLASFSWLTLTRRAGAEARQPPGQARRSGDRRRWQLFPCRLVAGHPRPERDPVTRVALRAAAGVAAPDRCLGGGRSARRVCSETNHCP